MIGVNGVPMKEIPVPKGTTIYVAIRASNLDKRIRGEDALEWKPERWLSPLPESVVNARIPGIYSHLYVIGHSATQRTVALTNV